MPLVFLAGVVLSVICIMYATMRIQGGV